MQLDAKEIYDIIRNKPYRDGEAMINELVHRKVRSTKITLMRVLLDLELDKDMVIEIFNNYKDKLSEKHKP